MDKINNIKEFLNNKLKEVSSIRIEMSKESKNCILFTIIIDMPEDKFIDYSELKLNINMNELFNFIVKMSYLCGLELNLKNEDYKLDNNKILLYTTVINTEFWDNEIPEIHKNLFMKIVDNDLYIKKGIELFINKDIYEKYNNYYLENISRIFLFDESDLSLTVIKGDSKNINFNKVKYVSNYKELKKIIENNEAPEEIVMTMKSYFNRRSLLLL